MWLTPETAPKTGKMILADIGMPWPCLACWNKADGKWVYASQAMNCVDGQDDPYFENEYAQQHELKRWMPLPEFDT